MQSVLIIQCFVCKVCLLIVGAPLPLLDGCTAPKTRDNVKDRLGKMKTMSLKKIVRH